MVLSLESSVPKERRHEFPRVFAAALGFITTLYIAFGVSGYASFGACVHTRVKTHEHSNA